MFFFVAVSMSTDAIEAAVEFEATGYLCESASVHTGEWLCGIGLTTMLLKTCSALWFPKLAPFVTAA